MNELNRLKITRMNLTLIKNFFLSDRKSIEPGTKVGRVLRRSFRVKRSKHINEKRKSGKVFLFSVFFFIVSFRVDYSKEIPMQSSPNVSMIITRAIYNRDSECAIN